MVINKNALIMKMKRIYNFLKFWNQDYCVNYIFLQINWIKVNCHICGKFSAAMLHYIMASWILLYGVEMWNTHCFLDIQVQDQLPSILSLKNKTILLKFHELVCNLGSWWWFGRVPCSCCGKFFYGNGACETWIFWSSCF